MIAAFLEIQSVSGVNPGLAPVASFSVSEVSPSQGDTIYFTDTSEFYPTSWSWYVNSSLFSNATNPKYYCALAGTFTFELVVENQFGSSNYSQSIRVNFPV
jgi:PKD repeat protein